MTPIAGFINMPGGPEWLIILVVILILFGPKNIPKIGKAVGRGIREFKDASDGLTRAIEEETAAAEREEEERKQAEANPLPAESETPKDSSEKPPEQHDGTD